MSKGVSSEWQRKATDVQPWIHTISMNQLTRLQVVSTGHLSEESRVRGSCHVCRRTWKNRAWGLRGSGASFLTKTNSTSDSREVRTYIIDSAFVDIKLWVCEKTASTLMISRVCGKLNPYTWPPQSYLLCQLPQQPFDVSSEIPSPHLGVGVLKVLGIPLLGLLVSWLIGFLVYWLQGFLVFGFSISEFLGVLVSKIQKII